MILGNSVGLAGHVTIEDWADVSPFSGVHQFCRIGRHAFVGPYSVIKQDVLPFSLTSHKPESRCSAPTAIGLERRGFDKAGDRIAADRLSPAHPRPTQYVPGHRAHSRRSPALPTQSTS